MTRSRPEVLFVRTFGAENPTDHAPQRGGAVRRIGRRPRILNERLCALGLLNVSDVFADLDGINELPLRGLALPSLNAGDRRP